MDRGSDAVVSSWWEKDCMLCQNICHLTHTDVEKDSRILKELSSLRASFPKLNIHAFGLRSDSGPDNFEVADGVKVYSVGTVSRALKPRSLRHSLIFIKLFIFIIYRLIRIRPSIVHCHDTLVLPIGFFYKKLTNCKLIYDAHELETQKNGQTWLLSKITYFFEKIAWNDIDLLITVSESIDEFYQEEFGEKKSIIILNSPSLRTVLETESNPDVRSDFMFSSTDNVYIYLGILAPGRGIELALSAFEEVALSNKIVFIGWGPLEKQIRASNRFGENIFVRQAVQHDLVTNYVSTASFGICMLEPISKSDYFALPNKLFEYAFAGIPVLASDFPDMKTIIKRHRLGECFNPNIEGLVNAIKQLENKKYNLKQKNLNNLSWQKQAEKLTQAYNHLGVFA